MHSQSILLTDADDPTIEEAVAQLGAWRQLSLSGDELLHAVESMDGVRAVLTATVNPNAMRDIFERAQARGIPVIVGCADETARRRAVELRADEWYRTPAPADEVAGRIRTALARAALSGAALAGRVELAEYEHMLYDGLTGLPTLPLMIERCRAPFKERGELVVLYFNFVRYSKIEEIYGWEKLDAVLETTAGAVREFLAHGALRASRMMVSHINDDDFVLFHVPPANRAATSDSEITEIVGALERDVATRIEAAHGEDVAALFDIYVGRAHVYYNPKIRLQRLIYRGIREAANAAKGIEERERARNVDDMRVSLRDQLVYVD